MMKLQFVCDPSAPWFTVDLRKHVDIEPFDLVKVVDQPRQLNANKIKDLQSLLPYIPPTYHQFYQSLRASSVDIGDALPLEDYILNCSESEESDCGLDAACEARHSNFQIYKPYIEKKKSKKALQDEANPRKQV